MSLSKTKFACICAGLFAAAGAPLALADNTVFLEVGPGYGENNPYQYSDGGEFTAFLKANGTTPIAPNAGYSSYDLLNSSGQVGGAGTLGFETFCVEDATYFVVGTTYDYTITQDVQVPNPIGGGYAGAHGYTNVPLSAGVAWLYQQFATGALGTAADGSVYNYTNTGARLADAGQLQQAIWDLQGAYPGAPFINAETGLSTPYNISSYLSNPFVNLAVTKLGSVGAISAATNGEFGVQVLNLYSGSDSPVTGSVYQNQLIYQGIPDRGSAAVLLSLGLLALAFAGRRQKRTA